MRRALFALALTALLSACIQTTGGSIVDFPVAAAGAADLPAGGTSLTFATDLGWRVTLTKATLHVGAVYLVQAAPVSGAQSTSCILPGTFIAQMTTGMDVDLLSPTPQRFPVLGHGTTGDALVGQVWLTGVDIDRTDDVTPVLVVEGSAEKDGEQRAFSGKITIGTNRLVGSGAAAGANPICKQRIVSVRTAVGVREAGGLLVRIDARELFTNVDFGALSSSRDRFVFADAPNKDQPSTNLYANLHAGSGSASPYAFEWSEGLGR